MQKPLLFIFILLLFTGVACQEKGYPKPKNLISEKKMVDILYDIHLSESISEKFRYNNPDSLPVGSKELYQSVLDKYKLTDSVLTVSIIYYSAHPKAYEKIYTQVIERMNMQQEEMKKQGDLTIPGRE
ncbi:MAG: DUF4296 domain-containing protein [Mangrovibacterium sp.]